MSSILSHLRRQQKGALFLWLLAGMGLLLYAAFTVQLALLGMAHLYQLDYGEGLVLHQTLLFAQGQSIYKPIDAYPYIFSNYPPLLQLVVSPLTRLAGPSFLPGRLVVFACLLALLYVLFALARRIGASRPAALAACLLFAGSPYIYHFAPLFRIDLPGLLLTGLGVLALTSRSLDDGPEWTPAVHSDRRLYLAALLFVLALYTKQSFIAAPLAAGVYFLLYERRSLPRFVAALAVFALPPFLVAEGATRGAFSFGLFTANVNPFSLELLVGQIRGFVQTFAAIIVLAFFAAPTARSRPGVVAFYGLAAVAGVALAGKVGAWENYFFEALFMLCVWAAVGIDRLYTTLRGQRGALLPLALCLQLALMWHDPRLGTQYVAENEAANRALASFVAAQPGMILSEDLGLLLVNGKEIPYFSFQYTQLARVGKWDQRWEIETLRAAGFGLVILEKGTREDPDHYQRFTRDVLSALDVSYGLAGEVGKYRLYTPLPRQRAREAVFGEAIALLGHRLDAAPAEGGIAAVAPDVGRPSFSPYPARLRVTLLWRAQEKTDERYKVFAHLEDAQGVRRGQADSEPLFGLYPTDRWHAGEIVRDYVDLDLPPGLPAGRYALKVGLYNEDSGQRLLLPDGSASLLLDSLPLSMTAPAATPPRAGPQETFANGVQLLAADLPESLLAAGDAFTVTLVWRASSYVDQDLAVFVHLVGADDRPLAQADGQPQHGAYPTSVWQPGEGIVDTHRIVLPADLPPGTYRLLAGLYDPATGARSALLAGGNAALLGEVGVAMR